jgi:hypothetical protein
MEDPGKEARTMGPHPRFVLTLVVVTIMSIFVSVAEAQHRFLERTPDGVILIYQDTSLGFALPGDSHGFPITITHSGSYRLASNIIVPDADTIAIEIKTNHVSLDLNGFAILGPTVCIGTPVTACSPLGAGIGVRSVGSNTIVRNGAVSGMGTNGVEINGTGGRVEGIHASSNGVTGIFVHAGVVVLHNTAIANGRSGFSGEDSIALGNVAIGNRLVGFELGFTSGKGQNVSLVNGDNSIAGNQTDGNVCGGVLCP